MLECPGGPGGPCLPPPPPPCPPGPCGGPCPLPMELGSELSPGDHGGEYDRFGPGGPFGGPVPSFKPARRLGGPFELFPGRNKFVGSSAAIQGDNQFRLCTDATAGALLETGVSAHALGGACESTGVLMLGFGCEDGF